MAISITVAGVSYSVPSSAVDTDWAAAQIAFEQALAATVATGPAAQRLSSNVTPVGTGADTTEDNLMTYTLPAGTLASNGQGIRVTACGVGVSTADVTTLRCYFGSTAVVTKVLEASQPNFWRVQFEVFRTGPATQICTGIIGNGVTANSTSTGTAAASETLSAIVHLGFTGQRASTSVANSIQQLSMLVELIP